MAAAHLHSTCFTCLLGLSPAWLGFRVIGYSNQHLPMAPWIAGTPALFWRRAGVRSFNVFLHVLLSGTFLDSAACSADFGVRGG